jgi:hypothetical protein
LVNPVDLKVLRWRKLLFAFMSRNPGTPAAYFDFRANVVVELSAQVQFQDLFPSPGDFTQQNERSPYRQTAPKKKQHQYSADHTLVHPYY